MYSQMKRCGQLFSLDFCFLLKTIQHHIHRKTFNSFPTNLHLISFWWNLNWIELNLNPIDEFKFYSVYSIWIQFKLHCNVIQTSMSYRTKTVSFVSRTFENYFLHWKFSVFLFLFLFYFYFLFKKIYAFNLGANEHLLHFTNWTISLLPFGRNLCILILFQHVISLTYQHVLFN